MDVYHDLIQEIVLYHKKQTFEVERVYLRVSGQNSNIFKALNDSAAADLALKDYSFRKGGNY